MFDELFPCCLRFSVEFFSLYVNIYLPRALDIPDFDLSLLEVTFCPLLKWLPLHIHDLLPLPELPPLPETPLPTGILMEIYEVGGCNSFL